jgi:predicted membrane protein
LTSAKLANPKGRMTLGIVLIVIGLVLTLHHAGILSIQGLGRWWPLLLIGIGIVKVRQPIEEGQRAAGTALLFVGCLLQIVSVLSFGKGWPLVFVALGGLLLWQTVERPPKPAAVSSQSPHVSDMALIGYVKRSLNVPDFRGGHITAVMGGVELDMRNATIRKGPAYLDVVAFWGGIELKVPAGWAVDAAVIPLMGGFENKTQSIAEAGGSQRLVLRGYAIMGGISIGN